MPGRTVEKEDTRGKKVRKDARTKQQKHEQIIYTMGPNSDTGEVFNRGGPRTLEAPQRYSMGVA